MDVQEEKALIFAQWTGFSGKLEEALSTTWCESNSFPRIYKECRERLFLRCSIRSARQIRRTLHDWSAGQYEKHPIGQMQDWSAYSPTYSCTLRGVFECVEWTRRAGFTAKVALCFGTRLRRHARQIRRTPHELDTRLVNLIMLLTMAPVVATPQEVRRAYTIS